MSVFTNIGEGIGTATSTGLRPLLPPLTMAVMAKANAGIDLNGTYWHWTESWFVIIVLALGYLAGWVLDRPGNNPIRRGGKDPEALPAYVVLAMVAGAIVFTGGLADGHHESWPGLVAGPVVAAVATLAFAGFFMRANQRLAAAGDPGILLGIGRDLLTVAVSVLVILVDVAGYAVALVAIAMLVRARTQGDQKYEGLRILR